jgi:hypothetical protein
VAVVGHERSTSKIRIYFFRKKKNMRKICSKCKKNKDSSSFYKDKKGLFYLRSDCKNCHNQQISKYRKTLEGAKKHKELQKIYNKTYKRKKYIKKYSKIYQKNRKIKDIQYKLTRRLRNRLYQALRGNYKTGSAVNDLGCTIPELKIYLENQFQPGMTWDNWGVKGWHIDHKKPLSKFNLINRGQLLKAVHFTNLCPLWAFDNLSKYKY